MALGLLRALHEAGLGVPEDVSVVGFDDVPESGYYTPPLTTVRQDFRELGERVMALVLRCSRARPRPRCRWSSRCSSCGRPQLLPQPDHRPTNAGHIDCLTTQDVSAHTDA